MTKLAVAVQPLPDVKVTEYVPEVLTDITGVVSVVDHKTVPLPTADRLTVGLAQVNVAELGLILTEAAVTSWITVVVVVLKQSLALATVAE